MRTNNLERNENSFQACKNLYVIAKEWHQEISAIHVVAYKGSAYAVNGCYLGDNSRYYGCTDDIYLKDLKLTDLDDICRTAAEEQGHYSVILRF